MAEQQGHSAAAAAAGRIKGILEAAERSAADLEAAARADAQRIRADAERDASRARETVARLAGRADQLDRRLDELAAAVREELAALKEEVDGLRVEPAPAVADDPATRVDPEADDELIAEAEAVAAREPEVKEAPTPQSDDATAVPEGARVLALKMALDGRPREETAGYLRENFELDDPEALLDEVYARAGH